LYSRPPSTEIPTGCSACSSSNTLEELLSPFSALLKTIGLLAFFSITVLIGFIVFFDLSANLIYYLNTNWRIVLAEIVMFMIPFMFMVTFAYLLKYHKRLSGSPIVFWGSMYKSAHRSVVLALWFALSVVVVYVLPGYPPQYKSQPLSLLAGNPHYYSVGFTGLTVVSIEVAAKLGRRIMIAYGTHPNVRALLVAAFVYTFGLTTGLLFFIVGTVENLVALMTGSIAVIIISVLSMMEISSAR